jgi:hypothetical protein
MKLISERLDDVEFLTETKNGEKLYYVHGPCAVAGVVNRNKRLYAPHILEREINEHQKLIASGQSMGELQHPLQPGIDLTKVSHRFVSCERNGNTWIAKARIIDTPNGRIAKGLLESGCKIGFSTRGVGELRSVPGKDYQEVTDSYHITCLADLVAQPSADCFVAGIYEGVDWIMANGTWVEKMRDQMRGMSLSELEERKLALFASFLRSL